MRGTMDPLVHLVAPAICQVVEFGKGGEVRAGKEPRAHKLDTVFDLAFCLSAVGSGQSCHQAVVGAEVEEELVERAVGGSDGTVDDYVLCVVVEDLFCAAPEVLDGVAMARDKGGGGHIRGELNIFGSGNA